MTAQIAVLTHASGVTDAWAAEVADATGVPAMRRSDRAVDYVGARRPPPDFAVPADLSFLPAGPRLKRLMIADMDSTIIQVECIDELADYAGVKAQVAAVTEQAMAGELDFEAALRARVALLAGLNVSVLEECYRERVRLTPGAEDLVRGMAATGATTALVSGGFTFFTGRVAQAIGFTEHRANTLIEEGGVLTGEVGTPILGAAAKQAALFELSQINGLTTDDVLAIGDGANDKNMVEAAGLGVGYHPKPALADVADVVLRYSDLSAVLALQGLSERTL